MYLRIQALSSQFAGLPLFGRHISVSISLVESRRIDGKPKQFYIGPLAYIGVAGKDSQAAVDKYFWLNVRQRMEEFNVPPEKQKHFIAQIEKLLAAIATAKHDPELRRRLEENPNKVLSELRRAIRTS